MLSDSTMTRDSMEIGTRWVKPQTSEPGQWKKQLAGKYLKLAERGDLKNVTKLLEAHPEYLNKRGSHGRTLLWVAVRKGRQELVEWLLQHGADPNLTGCYNSESFVQLSPLAACQFYRRNDLKKSLVRHGATDDVFRLTFLGESDRVLSSIDHSHDLLHKEDSEDNIYFTPLLTFAIVGDQESLIRELITRGFDVPKYSYQLLFIAAHFDNQQTIKLLLDQGATPEVAESSLWMSTDNLTTLKRFVDHGLSANQKPYHGLTPLLYACRADKGTHADKIEYLLSLGADVSATSHDGRSALHYSVMSGNQRVCKMLLDAGVDPRHSTTRIPSATDLARSRGYEEIASLIEQY